jgi:hypothetical protein
MSDTVLVIRPIHNAQKQAYEYRPVEVPTHIAEEQLTRPDEKRNHHWRGVRYATSDEHNAFYKIAPKIEKVEANTQTVSSEVIEKNKPGRKAKSE